MKKTLIFAGVMLIICANLFLFVYGIAAKIGASWYLDSVRVRYLNVAGLTLASHAYEDAGRPEELSGEQLIGRDRFSWSAGIVEPGSVLIKIAITHGGKVYTTEYLTKR
ncbi:MAG: hypothetical protein LLG37_01005 [Spirochaetia bacterium]|nr:hypothetical protein [Spirochaetia bacterium]